MRRHDVEVEVEIARLIERIAGLDRLTDEKFVKFRTLVDSQAEKVALALDAAKEAITKAEVATEKRFDGVNEFRRTLSDQNSTFMPRTEAEQRIAAVAERMESGREQVVLGDQKLDERLKALESGAANMQGRMWALGAGITVMVIIVNIAIALLVR